MLGLGCGIILFPGDAHALDPAKSLGQFNRRSWTRENGLPASRINSLTQTKDGYPTSTPIGRRHATFGILVKTFLLKAWACRRTIPFYIPAATYDPATSP